MPNTAELVRSARNSAGYDQAQLADRAGLSRFTISRIETGATPTPNRATLLALALALGITPGELRSQG